MKTLGNQADREEILRRLATVQPGSARLWGKMSAHQMICHLADSFRGVMGEKSLKPMQNVPLRGVIRWVALHTPLPWTKSLKTMPEMDQEIDGTPPAEFQSDVRELRRLFEKFTQQPRTFAWTPHPIFLEMSDSEWMIWGYRHMDHHLRQFGA